jgi:hypothetical protein
VTAASHRHRLLWLAAGLRRAAQDAGVDLPGDYAQRVAIDGIRLCDQLGVTPIGRGVAIHTAPTDTRQLPILLGYADPAGQWYRDGSRHTPLTPTATASAGMDVDTVGVP